MNLEELLSELEDNGKTVGGISIKSFATGTMREVMDSTSPLDKFNFCGVYVIYDSQNNIKYVGESYKYTIAKRLKLQTRGNLSNSTLIKHVAVEALGITPPVKELTEPQRTKAKEVMAEFFVIAIQCGDLETYLINECNPAYNTAGNKKSN